MNGDGFDDVVHLENASSLYIEYAQPDGSFTSYVHGNVGPGNEWSLCVADVDENGYNDLITGGYYNGLKLLLANADGSTLSSSNLPLPEIFLQGSNFADINNDGAIDYFACHDDSLSSPYRGDNTGTFVYDTSLIIAAPTLPAIDSSGNYGSVWTDFDSDGDLDMYLSKCRIGVNDPMDGRRVNQMWANDGNNNYTDIADSIGLRPLAQSWAADFADLDNDGDLDCFIINHDMLSAVYENIANDTFVNITPTSGMTFDLAGLFGIQVIMEDFDNDGLVDILFTSTGDAHRLFHNLGGLTFTDVSATAFPAASPGMQSAAVGDVNRDGFLDILGGFANGFNSWSGTENILFVNGGNSHHFLSIRLVGDSSHINGIGARVEIHGPFGLQVREVRSGESYGVMHSLNAHFGLGNNPVIDSLIVRWPSGVVDIFSNPGVDKFLTIQEGTGPCDCVMPAVRTVSSAANDGPASLRQVVRDACPCDTIRFAPSLDGDTIALQGLPLMIGKDLVIESSPGTVVVIEIGDAQSAWIVPPGVSLTLKDLQLRDTALPPLDPLLANAGNLILENVILTSTTPYPAGQAIVRSFGTMTHRGSVKYRQQ